MIWEYFSGPMGQLEFVATVALILNVYLLAKQKLSNYWFGLVGVLIFGYIFYSFQLYSDMLLQWVFYAPLQILGYFMWKHGKTLGGDPSVETNSMKIVRINYVVPLGSLWISAAIALPALLLGWYMASSTDASFPYRDALTTTMSVVASLLLLKKVLENWVIWILMDLIAIPLYYQKELYVTSGLYVIFLGLATYGLLTWIKEYRDVQGNNSREVLAFPSGS